ncbi:MAG: outer membrane lipoprotein carrier protein LolA [Tannerellaceae bacterium]|jgi:outer membrane lipoprotein-sorting protein|nr:outer membrane lipoprotein carrier protein LolA [Tannerellaceae bacterium]
MKNKQSIVLWVVGLLFCINPYIRAQHTQAASPEEQREMITQIENASRKMATLICNFEQVKTLSILNENLVSEGKMYYRNDHCLRWEYLSPYRYTFVLNNKTILMQAENSRNVVDVKSSRFFQEIIKIMMNGISGSGLTDPKSFDAHYYKREKEMLWEVHLSPQQREMKQMFATIKLTFNTKDYTVEQVEMNERSGDTTVIRLFAKQINEKIEDDTFHIH